jgi:hypothetical protein
VFEPLGDDGHDAITSRGIRIGLLIPPAVVFLAAIVTSAQRLLTGGDGSAGFFVLVVGEFAFALIASFKAFAAGVEQSCRSLLLIPLIWIYALLAGVFGYLVVLAAGPGAH